MCAVSVSKPLVNFVEPIRILIASKHETIMYCHQLDHIVSANPQALLRLKLTYIINKVKRNNIYIYCPQKVEK